MKQPSNFNISLKLLVLVWSLVFLCPCPSSHAFTLDELTKISIENRAVVKASKARLQKSRHQIKHAWGNFLPSLDAGYILNNDTGMLFNEKDHRLEQKENDIVYTTLNLNLFSGFKDIHSLASARKMHEMRRFELKGISQDIKLDVALCFLETYYAISYLKVAEDALSLYKKEYENVTLKCNIGILKKNDQLKIKVVMDNALQDVLSARTTLSRTINNLMVETATDIAQNALEFSCFDILPDISDMEHYKGLLLENHSEINALNALCEDLEIKTKSARSSFYPRVDIMTDYKYYDEHKVESWDDTRIQLNVSINLFDGFQTSEILKKAILDFKKASFDLIELKSQLTNRLKNILLEVDVSKKNLEVARSSRIEALEHLRITQLAFKKGILTPTDLLDAIYYLSKAKFNVLNSRIQIFRNNFQLARMIEIL